MPRCDPGRPAGDARADSGISLVGLGFVMQSNRMENHWAAEHLQVIRTLMERSALYRRAMAPIMLVSGVLGTVGAIVAIRVVVVESPAEFAIYWAGVAVVTLGAALLLVRRQGLEP